MGIGQLLEVSFDGDCRHYDPYTTAEETNLCVEER